MRKQAGLSAAPAQPESDSGRGVGTEIHDDAVDDFDRQGVKSVEVAGRILQALMARRISVSLKDLSQQTHLPAAKLHRYLTSLIRARLVRQDPRTRLYQLGGFAMELGAAAMHSSDVMLDAMRRQRTLRDAIDETVSLAIWSVKGPIVIHVEESSRSVLMTVRQGTLLPICATAAGIVFASFLAPHLTNALVATELSAENSDHEAIVTTAAEMVEVRHVVRQRMFFVNKGHLLPGVMAIATPLFDHVGAVSAVLSVVGRESHFTAEREARVISNILRIAGHKLQAEGAEAARAAPPIFKL
jgi:DNA-binding IclR family transcriptional regulator